MSWSNWGYLAFTPQDGSWTITFWTVVLFSTSLRNIGSFGSFVEDDTVIAKRQVSHRGEEKSWVKSGMTAVRRHDVAFAKLGGGNGRLKDNKVIYKLGNGRCCAKTPIVVTLWSCLAQIEITPFLSEYGRDRLLGPIRDLNLIVSIYGRWCKGVHKKNTSSGVSQLQTGHQKNEKIMTFIHSSRTALSSSLLESLAARLLTIRLPNLNKWFPIVTSHQLSEHNQNHGPPYLFSSKTPVAKPCPKEKTPHRGGMSQHASAVGGYSYNTEYLICGLKVSQIEWRIK